MLSDRMIIRVNFRREGEKGLIVTVENGIALINSTSNRITLQIDEEEICLKAREAVKILNLDSVIRTNLIDVWSDPISLFSDSEVRINDSNEMTLRSQNFIPCICRWLEGIRGQLCWSTEILRQETRFFIFVIQLP